MVSAGTHIKCAAGTLRAYLRRRTDDALASFVSSRSLSVRGSWGAAPSVFWFLLYAQKERPGGEPYRLCTLHILRDTFRRPQTIPCRVGIQILISKRPRPAARRLPTWSRISSAAHSSANRSPCRLAVPEKIFALLACSIFSTATDAPPRCIRHWRCSAPHPLPLPRSGGGAVWANNCLFKFQSRQRDFLRLTPRQIAVLAALRCPKKSSRCSLARFFRPLRMLRLAASATGGARLRIPIHRDPLTPKFA